MSDSQERQLKPREVENMQDLESAAQEVVDSTYAIMGEALSDLEGWRSHHQLHWRLSYNAKHTLHQQVRTLESALQRRNAAEFEVRIDGLNRIMDVLGEPEISAGSPKELAELVGGILPLMIEDTQLYSLLQGVLNPPRVEE